MAEQSSGEQARQYGRMLNQLKEQYTDEMGAGGDTDLAEAAAKIRAGEQVYGNEPSDGQKKLLFAADKQREQGQVEVTAEAESSSQPSPDEPATVTTSPDEPSSPADPVAQSVAQSTERFMDAAKAAGKTQTVGSTDVIEGNTYSATQAGDVRVLQNQETGGSLVAQAGEVLKAEGITSADQERMNQSAEKMEEIAVQQQENQRQQLQEKQDESGLEL
ncbi:hypothetical protein [Sphaerothrix gracilis]|uniref:hypothetical protein n=1 Tax=Sphaerothrix gracilis TaxID=3151835 RepID=UPI0031FD7D3C